MAFACNGAKADARHATEDQYRDRRADGHELREVVKMADEPGVVLYRDNYQNVRDVLSQNQKGDLLDALMDGEYQGDDSLVRMAYNVFFAAIQRTEEKYHERCEKNAENARKRWERHQRMQADAIAYQRMQMCATQTQTQTQTQTETHKKRNIFLPPTVEEVAGYCHERGNTIDAETFVDYYEARGWELKPGQKMKDWRASVRTWEKNKRGWTSELRGNRGNDQSESQRELYGL